MAEEDTGQGVSVRIPQALYERIASAARESDFSSVEEYILFVLGEVVSDGEDVFTEEEEEKVKERLRNLGYL